MTKPSAYSLTHDQVTTIEHTLRANPQPQGAEPGKPKMVVNMKLDVALVRRIDAAAKRMGVSRTAWMSMAAGEKLEAGGK
jgi:hypothetical protein